MGEESEGSKPQGRPKSRRIEQNDFLSFSARESNQSNTRSRARQDSRRQKKYTHASSPMRVALSVIRLYAVASG